MIKITSYALILNLFCFSCDDLHKEREKKEEGIVIKPEFRKYDIYIDDARFKIYLKMGMQKVAVKDIIHYKDSMLLGEMNLTSASCRELSVPSYSGLLVEFTFGYNDNEVFYNNSPFFVSSVFYRDMNIQDWFFAYGELSAIDYDRPRMIDTLRILEYVKKGGKLNPWFQKRIEDRLLNGK